LEGNKIKISSAFTASASTLISSPFPGSASALISSPFLVATSKLLFVEGRRNFSPELYT